MEALTANVAKTQFGELLIKAQRTPVQINKNGKPVAVVLSMDEYENIEKLKFQLLKIRAEKVNDEIKKGTTVDGESFFSQLEAGEFD
ncbi:MAG: type II toxin-antitoxin system Phd/YefM family antitoxin [Gammaproteobacteria bacterium]|nr:type II toxin-antitoxin system Phd/YefM family antitoxin [Gammaproteobacteria bacterium]